MITKIWYLQRKQHLPQLKILFDIKFIDATTTSYTLPPGILEISNINLTLKTLLPSDIKVKSTIDVIGKGTNVIINITKKFNTKVSFYNLQENE